MEQLGSRYLVESKIMMFHPDLALKIGLNEAIFLQQLHYWLQRKPKQYDNRGWVYNSYISWKEQMDFWSVDTIKRIVNNLVESGIVITDNFNTYKFDKTLWYSIDYEKLDYIVDAKENDDSSKLHQPELQIDTLLDSSKLHQPIPLDYHNNNIHNISYANDNKLPLACDLDNKIIPTTIDKQKKKKDKRERDDYNFELVWQDYPRKTDKVVAREFYQKWIDGRKINGKTIKLTAKQMGDAVEKYASEVEGVEERFIQRGSRFFNKTIYDYVTIGE